MDKKALSILKKYYGGIDYVNESKIPTADEISYCIKQGTMFENSNMSHIKVIKRIKELTKRITLEAAAKAFLFSLSTGQNEYRTVLSSYLYAKTLPEHKCITGYYRSSDRKDICGICGFTDETKKAVSDYIPVEINWNRLNARRFFPGAWNDIGRLEYVFLDLREFLKLPPVEPSEHDFYILNRIFETAKKLTASNKGSALVKLIKQEKILNATSAEIHVILGVLGMCGIFESPEHHGYLYEFTLSMNRDFLYENDLYYPFAHWRGNYGVNYDAVKTVFGSFAGNRLNSDKSIDTDEKAVQAIDTALSKKNNSPAEQCFEALKYIINLTKEERKYLALEDIKPEYETITNFSKTHCINKRTTFFYKDNTIVKAIYEERSIGEDGKIYYETYKEFDTNLLTDNRKTLLPLTSRGRVKPVTPTNVMAIEPFGCIFDFMFSLHDKSNMFIWNARNSQQINISEWNKINAVKCENDFHEFMKWYISTCPPDYFEKINRIKNMKHQTVQFGAGDIFRCEYDRNNYCYGLILGKTREIEKWDITPKKHSFRNLMTQPIMIRMFDIVTSRKDMTAEELSNIPLRHLDICSDNDIIWGTYPVVDHKKLVPSDIEFHFVCTKIVTQSIHNTLFTDDMFFGDNHNKNNIQYNLYIEWGFAQTEILFSQITDELKDYMKDYYSPHGGVGYSIDCWNCEKTYTDIILQHPKHSIKNNLLLKENEDNLKMIFRCLGINENTSFDEFARLYGGITADEFIKRVQQEE